MHPLDWAAVIERLSALFGPAGALALGFSAVALLALRIVWRTLRANELKHDVVQQELLKLVGANTESHERNAQAQREGSRAVGQLGETIDRLGQSLRDTEEQRRHTLDLLLQTRPTVVEARARGKGAARA